MAFPTSFPESDGYLGAPPGMEDECAPLSIVRGRDPAGRPVLISCWKFSRAELDEINRTGRVWLGVLGVTMPPAWLLGSSPFFSASAPPPAEPAPAIARRQIDLFTPDGRRPLTLREIREQVIRAALERNGGHKPAAARELGISLKTIYNALPRDQPGELPGGDSSPASPPGKGPPNSACQ